jgi:Flp pilus assembly protein TadG
MRARRGGYTVEFVLLLPVWISLIFGALDVGWLLYHAGALRTAGVLSCANAATIDPGESDENLALLTTAADAALNTELATLGIALPSATVDVTVVGTAPSRRINCTATADVASLSKIVLLSRTVTRHASAQLQWQRSEAP